MKAMHRRSKSDKLESNQSSKLVRVEFTLTVHMDDRSVAQKVAGRSLLERIFTSIFFGARSCPGPDWKIHNNGSFFFHS